VRLLPGDADALRLVAVGGHVAVGVTQDVYNGYEGTLSGGRLLLGMPSLAAAHDLIGRLGPVPVRAARTGPGRLDVPLQLWSVTRISLSPCPLSPTKPGVLVADLGQCVVAAGPKVSLSTADLQVLAPDPGSPGWRVQVGVDPADRTALAAFTRARTGKQIAFAVGGRLVSGAPTVEGSFSASFELPVDDRAAADALINRMRP
jgi:hypothetical protein